MSGNDELVPIQTQSENLAAILSGLTQRGVLFKLCEGVFRCADPNGSLSDDEETGLDICRDGLTKHLRITSGLCIACGRTIKSASPRVRCEIASEILASVVFSLLASRSMEGVKRADVKRPAKKLFFAGR